MRNEVKENNNIIGKAENKIKNSKHLLIQKRIGGVSNEMSMS